MLFRRRAHCGSLAADAAVCPKVRYNYTSSRLEVHARLDKVQLRKLCPAFDIKLVQERPHLARSSTYQAQKKSGLKYLPRLNNLYDVSNFENGKKFMDK